MADIISKNRKFIMGIAIIWVALYHIPSHTALPIVHFLQDIGYGGVDIFIFVSGFGIYYSLKKNSDTTAFLKRRMLRLLPAYLPFVLIWMVVRYVSYQLYFTEICGNLTMSGWWNGDGNQFNWYIDAIVLFYILSPYIYGLLVDDSKCMNKDTNKYIKLATMIIVSFIISFAFLHGQLLMAMSRLPVFILGMIVGYTSNDEKLNAVFTNKWTYCLLLIVMIMGFGLMYYCLYLQDRLDKWHYGLWWYPFVLIVPGLTLVLGKIGEWLQCLKIIQLIGDASFEIFLWHLFIFETAQAKHIEGTVIWIILYVTAFCAGILYHMIVSGICNRIKKVN